MPAVVLGTLILSGCSFDQEKVAIDPAQANLRARQELNQAVNAPEPFTRSHAIEALAETLGLQAGDVYGKALTDPSSPVRFAAAMAVGDTKYLQAKERLLVMAAEKAGEPDRRVLPAIIYALYQLGDDHYASELGALLFDREKEVRANAAMAMGRMGEPSAIGPLKSLLADEQDPMVRLQIVESLAMLGDTPSALSLEAYTKTAFLDERLVAIPAMARVSSPRAGLVFHDLMNQRHPPRVRVAAAGSLGTIGQFQEKGFLLCLDAATDPQAVLKKAYKGSRKVAGPDISSLQRLAAISLGHLGRTEAIEVLYPLLDSADGGVRVAAAMSIVRLLPGAGAWPPAAEAQAKPAPVEAQPSTPAVQESTTRPAETGQMPLMALKAEGPTTRPIGPAVRLKLNRAGAKD